MFEKFLDLNKMTEEENIVKGKDESWIFIGIFIVLFFLTIPAANSQFFDSKEMISEVNISSSLNLNPSSPNSVIEELTFKLLLYPQTSFRQEVVSLKTTPNSIQKDGISLFQIQNPTIKTYNFFLTSNIKTTSNFPLLKDRIPFPYEIKGYENYTKPTETVDSDNILVTEKASEILEGEDDYYLAVFKLASWTNEEIGYNLTTLTSEASQKASWVLINKQGVCDELTSLFIAMARSVGIPARFVFGISYTNMKEFSNPWGLHGWAEIYFPNVGWVPFDPTYGQFGWVDASHIELMKELDPQNPSVSYEWKARDLKVNSGKIKYDVTPITQTGELDSPIKMELFPIQTQIGFGSYDVIKAEITNQKDGYIADELMISHPEELKLLSKEKQYIALRPRETKTVLWLFNVGELQKGYKYTMPIVVTSSRKTNSTAVIEVNEHSPVYEKKEMEMIISSYKTATMANPNIEMKCLTDKKTYYMYENVTINCFFSNKGNKLLRDEKVCIGQECQSLFLPIGQSKQLTFNAKNIIVGNNDVIVKVIGEIETSQSLQYYVFDYPKISVENFEALDSVKFKDNFNLSFILMQKSITPPKDIKLKLTAGYFKREIIIEDFNEVQRIIFQLKGRQLKTGNNTVEVNLRYKNDQGKEFTTEYTNTIYLEKPNIFQRLYAFVIGILS